MLEVFFGRQNTERLEGWRFCTRRVGANLGLFNEGNVDTFGNEFLNLVSAQGPGEGIHLSGDSKHEDIGASCQEGKEGTSFATTGLVAFEIYA